MPGSNTGRRPTKAQLKTEKAAKRALAAEAHARSVRRKRLTLAITPVVVVILVIGIFVGVKLSGSGASNKTGAASTGVTGQVTGVPLSVFNSVGAGSAGGPTAKLPGPPLTSNGLPRILYVGAEWCPYCATERWPLAVALSRFGTLTNLGETASSPTDVYPNTATVSFHGSHYQSTVLSFSGVELENGQHQPLDSLDSADNKLFTTIGQDSYPFIDVGGAYQFGVQFPPSILAGKTQAQIAQALHDPSSEIAKAADGAANVLTAAICTLTKNSPSTVCNSPGVTAAAPVLALAKAQPSTSGK